MTAKQPSLNRMERGAEIAIGPVFFMVAIIGILASAIAVGGGTLTRTGNVSESVTVKMPIDPSPK